MVLQVSGISGNGYKLPVSVGNIVLKGPLVKVITLSSCTYSEIFREEESLQVSLNCWFGKGIVNSITISIRGFDPERYCVVCKAVNCWYRDLDGISCLNEVIGTIGISSWVTC